jgi:Transposase DDE domain
MIHGMLGPVPRECPKNVATAPRVPHEPQTRVFRIRQALTDLAAEDERIAAERARDQAKARSYEQTMTDPGLSAEQRTGKGRPPAGTDLVLLARARLSREIDRVHRRAARWRARQEQAAVAGKRIPGPRPVGVDNSQRVRRARAAVQTAQARLALQAAPVRPALPAGRSPHNGDGDDDANTNGAHDTQRNPERVRNLTDPDSRLMPSRSGWVQGYNAQLAVTDDQLIIAVRLVQDTGDVEQFVPMLRAAEHGVSILAGASAEPVRIAVVLADAGYASEANFTAPGPDRLIATGKRRDFEHAARTNPATGLPPPNATATEQMKHRLRTKHGLDTYRRRGVTVEPTNGQLKDRIGLRRFARRGIAAATSELIFGCAIHNLQKAYTSGLKTAWPARQTNLPPHGKHPALHSPHNQDPPRVKVDSPVRALSGDARPLHLLVR